MWTDFNHSISLLLTAFSGKLCKKTLYNLSPCLKTASIDPYKILTFSCTTLQQSYSIQRCTILFIYKRSARQNRLFFCLPSITVTMSITQRIYNYSTHVTINRSLVSPKKTVGQDSEATLSCSNNCPQKLSLDNVNAALKATGNTSKLE